VTGRLVLLGRLLVRDLRRRKVENILLLIAIAAASGSLTLGIALNGIATQPFTETKTATAGPDVTVRPLEPTPAARAAVAELVKTPGVTGHSGPYPLAFKTMTVHGKTVHAVVEGRDRAPAPVDQPAITDGTWVRPGGVVVERAFAEAMGVRTGDTVRVGDRALPVIGTAVSTAFMAYPHAGWHEPGRIEGDHGGLVWVDRGDLGAVAAGQPLSYILNLTFAHPPTGITFPHDVFDVDTPINVTTWAFIKQENGRLLADAQYAMMIGTFLLTFLALAGVLGIVAGRVIAQRRRVGLLKAVGAGPGIIALSNLVEYLVIALAGAGAGLAGGWLLAPVLTRPGASMIGSVGVPLPTRGTVIAATVLALAIAGLATLVPVIRAATTSTIHALADAAAPPRRRGWRVWLSRRLPTPLLIGVRINARRPRRARLVTMNTLITTTGLVAVVTAWAHDPTLSSIGDPTIPDPRNARLHEVLILLVVALGTLALINTAVSTWTAVLDARQPLAVARTLGATPAQAALGLAVAQLLPALPGAALGLWFGYRMAVDDDAPTQSYFPMIATTVGVVLAVAVLTAVPALLAARRPVAETLRSAPT